NTWLLAGFAIGPLVGGFLVDAAGFRLGLLSCAAFTAVGLAVAVVALPETAPLVNRKVQLASPPIRPLRRRLHNFWGQQVESVRTYRSLLMTSVLFLITMFAGDGVILSTLSLLLQERLGPNVAVGGLALGVASAGGLLLSLRAVLAGVMGPLAGHLSDVHFGRWSVIASSLLVGVAGFGLLAFATSPASILLAVALSAVSSGAALATLIAYAGDLAPQGSEGAVMGVYATAGDIGSMAGPFVAFGLLSIVGLRWVYLLSATLFLAGLWLIWYNRRS
ncbi:MAG: MFS transporter, partial [Chloroflexi bacterium]